MGSKQSGRGGLPPHLQQRIYRLLASGVPPYEVANRTGVDRKTAVIYSQRARSKSYRRCQCGALFRSVHQRCMACDMQTEGAAADAVDDGFCECCESNKADAKNGVCLECRREFDKRLEAARCL